MSLTPRPHQNCNHRAVCRKSNENLFLKALLVSPKCNWFILDKNGLENTECLHSLFTCWREGSGQGLIARISYSFQRTIRSRQPVWWFWPFGIIFFSKPEKNDFDQKNQKVTSTNIFAIPLLISPSALNLPSLSHFVYARIMFSHSFFSFFSLSSLFYSACPNVIYFVLILHFFSVLSAIPLAEGILFLLPIQLPSSF